MSDGSIPPPNFNFHRKDLSSLEEELAFSETESNFRDYLDRKEREDQEKKNKLDEESERREAKLKRSLAYEEIQEEAQLKEKLKKELEPVEEEDAVYVEGEESDHEKKSQGQKKESKQALRYKGSVKEHVQEMDDEDQKLMLNNQLINEEGEELDSTFQDDPITQMKQEVEREKNMFVDEAIAQPLEEIAEQGDDKTFSDTPKNNFDQASKDRNKTNQELPSKEVSSKQTKKESRENKSHDVDHDKHTKSKKWQDSKSQKTSSSDSDEEWQVSEKIDNEAFFAGPSKLQEAKPQNVSSNEVHKSSFKSKTLQDLEKLVMEILSEAQVLEDGDVTETRVALNLGQSIFDQGEVVVTSYKYRPLEVNLKFSNFNKEATNLLRKNSKKLKKVLKEKSLKVHQLDIVED